MPKTRDYDSWRLEKLSDPERAARYLKAALEESTEAFFHAFKNVIQAHEVAAVAKKAGVARESLYRSFSAEGNPTWGTLQSVLEALDLKFSGIEPRGASSAVMPVPEAPKAIGFRKPRRRRRKIPRNPQQLMFPFRGNVATSAMPRQNASSSATRSTAQRNTGTIATRVEAEPQAIAFSPGFLAYVQEQQSTVLTIGH